MNWLIIIVVGILAIFLIIFLVIRNQKDKKKFTGQLNNDYSKPRDEEGDIEVDDTNRQHPLEANRRLN